jgi:protein involved in polysaccharide export with SLBB domain
VHAEALTRIAVLGAVGRPGYYALPADILLGDAIMAAGGPSPNADVTRTIVRRGKSEVLSKGQVQAAIRDGRTLDRMDLRAGDEIVVAEKKQRNVMNMVYAATGVLSLALTLYALANR